MKMRRKLFCVALIGYASVNVCRGSAPGADEGPPRRCCPDLFGGLFGGGGGAPGTDTGPGWFGGIKRKLGYISGGIKDMASKAFDACKTMVKRGAVKVVAKTLGRVLQLDPAKQKDLEGLMLEISEAAATPGKWKKGRFEHLMARFGEILGLKLDGIKEKHNLNKKDQAQLEEELAAYNELLKEGKDAQPTPLVKQYLDEKAKRDKAKADAEDILKNVSSLKKNPSGEEVYAACESLFTQMNIPKEKFEKTWSQYEPMFQQMREMQAKMEAPTEELSKLMKNLSQQLSAKPVGGMRPPAKKQRAIPPEKFDVLPDTTPGPHDMIKEFFGESNEKEVTDLLSKMDAGAKYAELLACIGRLLGKEMDCIKEEEEKLENARAKQAQGKELSEEESNLVDQHQERQAELEAAQQKALKDQAQMKTAMENLGKLGFRASAGDIQAVFGSLAGTMSESFTFSKSFKIKWNKSSSLREEMQRRIDEIQKMMFPPEPTGPSGVEKAVRRLHDRVASVGAGIHRAASVGAATAAKFVKDGANAVNAIGTGIRRAASAATAGKSSIRQALALANQAVGR